MRQIYRDSLNAITDSAITRLARKSGALRLSGDVYDNVRSDLRNYLEDIEHKAILFTNHNYRMTVTKSDVESALHTYIALGQSGSCHSYDSHLKPSKAGAKKRKSKSGVKALREIRYHQKNSNCLVIPKASFSRLAREVAQDFHSYPRFQEDALFLLQTAAENHLTNLFDLSVSTAVSNDRKTVSGKDIRYARKVLDQDYKIF